MRRFGGSLGMVALMLLARPGPAFAQSVTERFGKAQRYYNQGKSKPAYKILVSIVKKYPDHQPSRLLLGSLLFRTGHLGAAARQFKRASPDLLSGDIAYEYGITFFQAKDCRRAKVGFGKVSTSNRFDDLASFYRGLCHLQGREYQKAQFYLNRAKKLPPALERKRREALRITRRVQRSERQGNVQMQSPYTIAATPLPPPVISYDPYAGQTPPPQPETGPPAEVKKPAPPPPPQSGTTNTVTPSLTLTQKAVSADFFGTKEDNTEIFISELKVAFKSKYDAQPRGNGGQPYASLAGDVGQTATNSRGSSVAYSAKQETPGDIIESETAKPPVTATVGIISVNPEVGYPASAAIDLTAGVKYKDTLPDMKTEGKNNELGPYGSFNFDGETTSLKLTGSQTTTDNQTAKFVKTGTVLLVDLSKRLDSAEVGLSVQKTDNAFKLAAAPAPGKGTLDTVDTSTLLGVGDATKTWDSFAATFAVTYTAITNNLPTVFILYGEQSSIKIELNGTRTFDFGGSLAFSASSAQLTDFQDYVTDVSLPKVKDAAGAEVAAKSVVKANGTRNIFSTTFKLTPFDWIFGSASYKYTTLSVQMPNAALNLEFQKGTSEVTTEFTLQAGLSKTF